MILKLDNLARSFGSLKAVDGVTLEVASGEALGIIGPNGAGKSTLFNLITGLLKPDTGTVHFNGNDITHTPPRTRCIAGIGRSFQIPHPFENLTVFENLLVAGAPRYPAERKSAVCSQYRTCLFGTFKTTCGFTGARA